MNRNTILFLGFLFLSVACNPSRSTNPDDWSEKELQAWFTDSEWKHGWEATADKSINQKEFALQYSKNANLWDKAFEFLKNTDLVGKEPGKYEVAGTDVFVIVMDYQSKDEDSTKFEAHKKYADIHYVAKGEERIGAVPLEKAETFIPYDAEKDIYFLRSEMTNYLHATPDKFFVFFPSDAHRPSVEVNENSPVRKVVIKVRVD